MGEGKDPVFKSFAWKAINTLAMAMVKVGQRPNISNILRLMESGPDELLIKVLENHFNEINLNWKDTIRDYELKAQRGEFEQKNAQASKEAVARVEFYKEKIKDAEKDRDIESLITMFEHSREHFSKMVAGLLPVLSKLDSEGLDALLSPKERSGDEDRPVLNSAGIINQKMVLYVGLDSLADSEVSSALGSILLADLTAVAADRYNFGVDDTKISLFVDEAAEIVSAEFLQLCNKARGAGFKITFATQTIADFESRLGSASKAMQLIANANNVISLRVKDETTLKFISEKFGESVVITLQKNQNTQSIGSDRDVSNYTGSYGEKSMEVVAPTITTEMLSNLPNLEFFASLSAGRIIKGRLPLFVPEDMPSYKDQFWLRRDV
jgi:conjugal transfer pilus assembly protein TraD